MLDTDFIRARFPALGTDWTLLDNAGGSVPARAVIDVATDYMQRHQVQLGASYGLSAEAAERVQRGREAAARLVNADANSVVLGSSATMLARILASALAPTLEPGDEIIVTNLDHEANIGPWRALEERGVVLREWRFHPERHTLELEGLEPLLNERTQLVAFTHCANVVGTIHDVAAITRRVHAAGAAVCVDGVAFAPHRRVDVQALDVDYYLLSLYKTYGPHLGLLYGKPERLAALRNQNHFFIGEENVPYKLEPGNVNHELTASLVGITDYLDELHAETFPQMRDAPPAQRLDQVFEAIAQQEEQLVEPLLAFLRDHPRVNVLGSTDAARAHRAPTVAFTVDGRDAGELPPLLDERRIAVRCGHFYAYRAMRDMGLLERGGVVRASLVHYNTPAEIAALISALDDVL